MKIAIAEFPMYIGHPIEEMVAEVGEIGYGHIELAGAQRVAGGAGDDKAARSLVRALESQSVGLAAIGAGVPLASADEEVRHAAVQDFAGTVRLAGRLGCALVTSEMSGGNSLTQEECVAAFERSVSELVPVLEAEGVRRRLRATPRRLRREPRARPGHLEQDRPRARRLPLLLPAHLRPRRRPRFNDPFGGEALEVRSRRGQQHPREDRGRLCPEGLRQRAPG